MKIQLDDCDNDSSTEGIYETVEDLVKESSKTRLRKPISKEEQKQPQLPGKNNKQKVVATIEGVKNNASYSRSKKVKFIAKTVYNEDDEEFEEIVKNKNRGFRRVNPAAQAVSESRTKNQDDKKAVKIPVHATRRSDAGNVNIQSGKFCHFWNNVGKCSYKNCKFLHEKSPLCKYDGFCTRSKCMFSHIKQNINFLSNRQQSAPPHNQARFHWRSPWATPPTTWSQPWSYNMAINHNTQWGQRMADQ